MLDSRQRSFRWHRRRGMAMPRSKKYSVNPNGGLIADPPAGRMGRSEHGARPVHCSTQPPAPGRRDRLPICAETRAGSSAAMPTRRRCALGAGNRLQGRKPAVLLLRADADGELAGALFGLGERDGRALITGTLPRTLPDRRLAFRTAPSRPPACRARLRLLGAYRFDALPQAAGDRAATGHPRRCRRPRR